MTVVVEERAAPGAAPMELMFERVDLACSDCGYGVVRQPERCPMCGGEEWRARQPRIALH